VSAYAAMTEKPTVVLVESLAAASKAKPANLYKGFKVVKPTGFAYGDAVPNYLPKTQTIPEYYPSGCK
jgi:hypothetical protein